MININQESYYIKIFQNKSKIILITQLNLLITALKINKTYLIIYYNKINKKIKYHDNFCQF